MRIRHHLLMMTAAILVPIITAGALALYTIRNNELDAALRGLRESVRATSLLIDRDVQGAVSALQVLGNSHHLTTGNLRAFQAQAAFLDRLPEVWTVLLNANGQQLVNTIVPFGTPLPVSGSPERIAQVIASQQPLMTDLLSGPVAGKLVTGVYVPAAAGDNSYVLAQTFAVEHWGRVLGQTQLPPDWIVAVIDRSGRFIYRSHKARELLGQPARAELVAAAKGADDGLIRHSTLEGIESYDAFTHSTLSGWTIAIAAPVASVEAKARRALRIALLGMVLALAMAAAAVATFGRSIIQALDTAASAAAALGQGRQPVHSSTSIREVRVLNAALFEAGQLLAAERRARLDAERERERLLTSETAARETAQAENVAKDQFLAMLGHELRNPLAAIAGATALLQNGSPTDDAARYLEMIRRQNAHLSRIVDDLLDISRLLAGKIDLERQTMDLADAINSCVESVRATQRAQGYRLTVQATPAWVSGDPVRIEQILNNLITNALKFSPPGGEVRVALQAQDAQATVTISDDGVGMPADLVPRVFEPFVQGPPTASRAQSGLGIGLALVRQLVELHGGSIVAHSAGLGRGSSFTLHLPSVPAPLAAEAAASEPTRRPRTVLLVEDNEDARVTMGALLDALGYTVVEVATGGEAVGAALRARPDVIVLDIGLPDIDGHEVARRLRCEETLRAVPLIALTGYGGPQAVHAGQPAPFAAHLGKPIGHAELAAVIEQVCTRTPRDVPRPA